MATTIAGPRSDRAFVLAVCGLFLFGIGMAQDEEAPRGQSVFEGICAACHQVDGEGAPPTFPALAGNDFVTGDPRQVVRVPLEGRGAMPSFADSLTDQEIADAVTYARSSWGNDASAVDADVVAEVRAEVHGEESASEDDADREADADTEFAWRELGEDVFSRSCAACHQSDGQGIEGIYPALAGNEFVQGEAEEVTRVPLKGRAGMPSFEGDLTDEELAAVVSYVRNAWGNEASVVTPDDVAAIQSGDSEGDGEEGEEEGEGDPRHRPGAAN